MKLVAMNTITIGWDKGDKFAEVDLPSNHRLNNRLKRLHEQYPEEFGGFLLNKDGTLYAQIPVRWIRIQRPAETERPTLTEEQKAEMVERMKAGRERRRTSEENERISHENGSDDNLYT